MNDFIKELLEKVWNLPLKEVAHRCCTEKVADDSLCLLFTYAGIAALLIFIFFLILMGFRAPRIIRNRMSVILRWCFALTWIFGFMVYEVGMYIGDGLKGLLQVAPMAIVHAFGMFLYESDVSTVHEPFHNSLWYMTWFSLAHFLAGLFSLIFILRYIGFYITVRLKLRWKSLLTCMGICNPKKLNVFWGINNDSLLLAENIIKNSMGDVVFVRILGDEESQTSTMSFGHVLKMIKLNDNVIENLRNNGYYVTSLFRNAVNETEKGEFSIGKTLGLGSLSRLLEHTEERVNIFLFDDIDSININNLISLARDSSLTSNKKVHFYFKARYNATNDIIEHTITHSEEQKLDCNIHLVDTAYLSVADLMMKEESHPVNAVNIEKDGTVSSSFDALLIGFGQTGENAFRYLYEFSAFASKDMIRSEYNFTIVDKKANFLWDAYKASKPDLAKSKHINCEDAEIGSAKYWDAIKGCLDDLNYVVIATGNDEENLNAAIELYKVAVKERQTLDNFCVYFRVYSAENEERIQHIVEGYNGLVGKKIFYTFGKSKDMLSYDNIVNEKLLEEAKDFNANYEGKTEEEKDVLWEKLSVEYLYQKNHKVDPTYTYLAAIAESRNKKEQNISNGQHRHTKIRLMGEDFIKDLPVINRKFMTVNYEGLSSEQKHVMDIIACTEHLRWIAKQELLGYIYGEKKDYIRLTHYCMVDWNNKTLSDDKKSWDYNVVDTSIKMKKDPHAKSAS